jgi:sporulation protein YlmC with PRC-barrel domain
MNHISYASLLVSVAVSSLTAQELPRDVGNLTAAIESQAGAAARSKASRLVGCTVIDSKSKTLGEIQDVVLDVGNHRIAYAVVTFEKSLGMGEKCFVMPWKLIEVGRSSAGDAPHATLSLDWAMLEAAPGFSSSEWPDMTEATWSKQVDNYYSSQTKSLPKKTGAVLENSILTNPAPSHCLLSKLYGTEVVDQQQRTLATVEDLVVDTGSAAVDGVLLSFGGNLGEGEQFALVPSKSLSIDKNGAFVLPCSHAGLKTMALKDGKLPVLNQNAWLSNARELCAKVCKDTLVGDGDVIFEGASAVRSPVFADSYDLASVQTIKGKIATVGSVLVGKSKEERVRLRIIVGQRHEVIVYAAPVTFEQQQALGLRAGDTVKVTGAPAKHFTHTVLIAGDITSSGKTAKLRDSQGRPSWIK